MAAPPKFENMGDQDPSKLLAAIREKAEKLLNQLEAEQAEIEKNPPKISTEAMAEGRAAMSQAIAAAKRTIEALEMAAGASHSSSSGKSAPAVDEEHRWN